MDRAEVRNAADPQQVKRAARKDRDREALLSEALRATLSQPAGRFVLWDLLERAGVFTSVFAMNQQIYYNAGRQDFGHELLALLVACDEDLYTLMEKEARDRKARDNRATDASHTPKPDEASEHI
jgi:hypothetical protein